VPQSVQLAVSLHSAQSARWSIVFSLAQTGTVPVWG
jgi:hypothetical protein